MIDESLLRPADIMKNKVDSSKAAICLGWKAKSGMKEVVERMFDAEMRSLRNEGI